MAARIKIDGRSDEGQAGKEEVKKPVSMTMARRMVFCKAVCRRCKAGY